MRQILIGYVVFVPRYSLRRLALLEKTEKIFPKSLHILKHFRCRTKMNAGMLRSVRWKPGIFDMQKIWEIIEKFLRKIKAEDIKSHWSDVKIRFYDVFTTGRIYDIKLILKLN